MELKAPGGATVALPGGRIAGALFVLLVTLSGLYLLTTPRPWLAFLPALLVLALTFIGHLPQAAYYLMIFLVPFGAYRKIYGSGYVINIPWLIALALVAILFLLDFPKKTLFQRLRSDFWPLFLCFGAVSVISSALSDYPQTVSRELMYLAAGYAYVAFGMLLIDVRGLRRGIPLILVVSVSLGSLTSVIGYLFKIPFFALFVEGAKTRGTGFSTDPNNMSLMIIFILPLIAFAFFHSRSLLVRILMVPLFLVNVAAVGSTFSRGGFVVFLLCALLLLLEHLRLFRPRHLGFLLLAAAGALVLLRLAVPQDYWARQQTLASGTSTDTALSRRATYLTVGWEALREKPFLGSGPGTFRDLYALSPLARHFAHEESDNFFQRFYRRRAHNTYLEVVVGTGMAGLALFLLILWKAFSNFSRASRRFAEAGDAWTSNLVRSYRMSFLLVALYLLIYSDLYHKYLLLSLALSQCSLSLSLKSPDESALPS